MAYFSRPNPRSIIHYLPYRGCYMASFFQVQTPAVSLFDRRIPPQPVPLYCGWEEGEGRATVVGQPSPRTNLVPDRPIKAFVRGLLPVFRAR